MNRTLFLRTPITTIVEIEVWNTSINGVDLSVSIDIEQYSKLLLSVSKEQQPRVVELFTYLDTLRSWVFEVFLPGYTTDSPNLKVFRETFSCDLQDMQVMNEIKFKALLINLRKGLQDVGEELNLYYCED